MLPEAGPSGTCDRLDCYLRRAARRNRPAHLTPPKRASEVHATTTFPASITDTSGSIQNAQMPAPINNRHEATTNGATHDPRSAKIPKTVGDSAPPICPTIFIIPETVPEYSPPMSMGTAHDGPMTVSRKNIAPVRDHIATWGLFVSAAGKVKLPHP